MKRVSYRFPRFAAVAAVALSALLTLAGCSNNPYPPGESAQSVRYTGWGTDLRSMDPTISYTATEGAFIDSIYECYFKYDHLKEKPYVLDLGLGAEEPKRESVPLTVTDAKTHKSKTVNGEQWTFHIKKGLRFQDDPCFPGGKGREITAEDFIYSWRRMADPHLNCPILSFVQDKIQGMDELVQHNTDLAKRKQPADYKYPVPGLVLDPKDPYTFQLRLVQPYPQLRFLMTMHFTTPIAHEAVEKYGDDFARHPVGCGSYKMTEYRPKQRITLEKNDNALVETYPNTGDPGDREAGLLQDAGKPLPLTDKIVFVWTKEAVTSWNLFQQGYLDAVGVSKDNFNSVLQGSGKLTPEMQKRGIRLQRVPDPAISYFAFNMKDPVWGGYTDRGRKLRQAVSLCIDRQQFIDVMLQGFGRPADFMLPEGLFGYEASYHNPYSRHDIEKAKQLLTEAGYPNGVDPATGQRLTLTYDIAEAGPESTQQAIMVKQWLQSIGVEMTIQTWQSVTWEERVLGGKSQFFSYGWIADYPDPENFLQLMVSRNAGVNYAAYNRPEFDQLYDQMRSMSDSPERMEIIRKMRTMLQEDCPWIYFYHSESVGISYPWLRNNKPHGIANDGIRYTYIDAAQRAAFQAAQNKPNPWPIVAVVALFAAGSIPAAATVKARRNRSVRRHRPTSAPGEETRS